MRNFIFSLALFLCPIVSQLSAQEGNQQSFEARARAIAEQIAEITREEKAALKFEVETVNRQLEAGNITGAEADERKLKLAETRARAIENRVAEAQRELTELVKDKVDGKIREKDTSARYEIRVGMPLKFKDRIRESARLDSTRGDMRTTSQFVFSTGWNNVMTNGNVSHSDFHFNNSAYYEWGLSFTTRLFKKSNLFQGKYGLSLMYNNLRPTDNRYFVADGNQTYLEESEFNLKHSRLRNVYLTVPLFLELDFGRNNRHGVFRKQAGWRMGMGGYGGIRLKSKQVLRYEVDGDKVETRRKGDFNASDFQYGLAAYIGHKNMSLYAKYDLNPLFASNPVDQHNVSLGLRFDFN